jgi:uncharacterized protein (TIGR00251 family)
MNRERDATGELELVPVAGRTRLRLRVKPGSKRNSLLGIHGGALKLGIIARPERGKANRAVLRFLALQLDLAATDIDLVGGASSQDKTVLVPLSPGAVRERLTHAFSKVKSRKKKTPRPV